MQPWSQDSVGQVELSLLSLGSWDASLPMLGPAPITLQPPPSPLQVLQTPSVLLECPAHCQAHCSQLIKGERRKYTQTIATGKWKLMSQIRSSGIDIMEITHWTAPGKCLSECSLFGVIFWFCNVQVLNGLSFYFTMHTSLWLGR